MSGAMTPLSTRRLTALVAAIMALALAVVAAPRAYAEDRLAIAQPGEIAPGVAPIDPQRVADLDQLTWDDYVAVPGTDWSDPGREPTVKRWRSALVLVDYLDEPFMITRPAGSSPWGDAAGSNPSGASDVPREDVPQFYADFLNTPSELNRGRTLNAYWMENSAGRYGVELVPFGPYQLPKKSYQYHYPRFGNKGPENTRCPASLKCDGDFRADIVAAWKADTKLSDPVAEFDNVFFVGAGMGQSSTWLEFGQMRFAEPGDVPDEFGPPKEWRDAVRAETGEEAPNWSSTRYVDWTSWKSAATLWADARGTTSTQAESSGHAVYAHELSHNLTIGDNYGNPYADKPRRDASGPFDMMSRGTFNGPGGQHQRWRVLPTQGSALGPHHLLRDKVALGMVDKSLVVQTNRAELEERGILRTRVQARAVQGPDEAAGINIALGGDRGSCAAAGAGGRNAWRCDGGDYDNYTLEVVDRMGNDSFTPDSGVLLVKTKDDVRANPGKWMIDANPQDIGLIDYIRGDGVAVPMSRGDHRQLNDGLFKAGTGSGSQFEYTDRGNGLQFYVLGTARDERGVLSYDLAVRSLGASDERRRGVKLAPGAAQPVNDRVVSCTFRLANTGAAGGKSAFSSDVYRLSGRIAGSGWRVVLPAEVAAAEAGGSVDVQAYAVRDPGAAGNARLDLTATSESNANVTATANCAT